MQQVDYEKVGQRIHEQRKFVRRISQEKMAEDLGMYQADISNLEKAKSGSGIQDLSKLEVIANYFDIPLEKLLFGLNKGDTMKEYHSASIKIKTNDEAHVFKKEHLATLKKLTGTDPTKIRAFSYDCGPYTVYILNEVQFSLNGEEEPYSINRLHFYTFFENAVIASMTTALVPLMEIIFQPTLAELQNMIPFDVLDVYDCWRTLNPFEPLRRFAFSEEEEKELTPKIYERMDALREYDALPVVFIESIYVNEDCRQKGMCRLLLDILSEFIEEGDYIAWLNMEPSPDELDVEYSMYPVCTTAAVGQMSINAAIAEKLGFTVDPDTWHREVEVVKSDGTVGTEVVLVRKCAYKIADCIKPILADDGDLVEQGRARQKIAHAEDDPDSIADFYDDEVDGKHVAEITFLESNGKRIYLFGVKTIDDIWYGISEFDPLKKGLMIPLREKYVSLKEAKKSEYSEYYELIGEFFNH